MPEKTLRWLEWMRGPARWAMNRGAAPLSNAAATLAYTARHREWLAADAVRARLRHEIDGAFDRWQVILAPIAPVAAFPHDPRPFQRRTLTTSDGRTLRYDSMLTWIALATALHLPATAIPAGTLIREYSYFSVTELSEYMTTEEDNRAILAAETFDDSAAFEKRASELAQRKANYEHFRLYPELPDWEVMGFYPMSKRRAGNDNWYTLDFDARKKLMGGHARVGRKYSGRISQLISGSTGLDDWEWGVTLMAHQVDALKEIVNEMRFDEVTARYGEFGRFFISMTMPVTDLWLHLHL